MPIPPFNEYGLLPLGLHLAEMNEIVERFGTGTPRRQMPFERLRVFIDLAQHCGALRMFVNGSYVTAKPEPGDVDVVIWLGAKFLDLLEHGDRLAIHLEEIFDTREPEEAFSVYEEIDWNAWIDFFSCLREEPNKRKGLVEVKLS